MSNKPVSSFAPKFLELLLKGAIEPQRFYAENDKRAPVLFKRDQALDEALSERTVRTRWHKCVFTTREAAGMYQSFMRIAQQLHLLRVAMRDEKHAETETVYKVRISVDDRIGALVVEPAGADLEDVLERATKDSAAQHTIESPLLVNDPLANM